MSQIIIRFVGACAAVGDVGPNCGPRRTSPCDRAPAASQPAKTARSDDTPANVLIVEEWRRVDHSVDRGLAFLASQQQPDGSFPTLPYAQPGVTSLCVLAFMAHGHAPGSGPYGEQLERAVKFIAECQKPNGLIMLVGSDEPQISREIDHDVGVAGTYDHAISSLTLSELYGMNPSKSGGPQLKNVINKSLPVSLEIQRWPKDTPEDEGGWRYIHDYDRVGFRSLGHRLASHVLALSAKCRIQCARSSDYRCGRLRPAIL